MPLNSGQVLQERYRIDGLLGQGGMGAVYRGTNLRFDAPVAIKENQLVSPESQKQFAREAGLLHRLRHPNLPRVSDHFYIAGQGQYLVMDYIEGDDLKQVLARQGAVPQRQALDWMGQVLDALAYLHGEGVIHRDVKPANVKITPQGQVFLVDFGLAKEYDPAQKTTVGARGVTPGFAPPEQYGYGRTDARTDVYSAGATLYALLTGQQPPDALDLVTRQTALVPPRQLNPNLSPEVEAAVLRAMEAAPDDRFQTAAGFRSILLEPPTRLMRREEPMPEAAEPVAPLREEAALANSPPARVPVPREAQPRPTSSPDLVVARADRPHPTPVPNIQRAVKTWTRPADGAVMVYVPVGEFLMGSSDDDGQSGDEEEPQHKVYLDAFWIDVTPVTNAQYRLAVESGVCRESQCWVLGDCSAPNQPVVGVNWHDAQAYAAWVGGQLPTEAEWEKAARGTDGRQYPWGNHEADCTKANYRGCLGTPSAVGSCSYGASPYGALDMAGNVWEWVADWYGGDYYQRSPSRNPQGPDSGDQRVLRGGAFNRNQVHLRCANRNCYRPDYWQRNCGFRVVMEPDPTGR